jgi:hypothetical protein
MIRVLRPAVVTPSGVLVPTKKSVGADTMSGLLSDTVNVTRVPSVVTPSGGVPLLYPYAGRVVMLLTTKEMRHSGSTPINSLSWFLMVFILSFKSIQCESTVLPRGCERRRVQLRKVEI